ncbi:chaperonin containing TCP1 subunit 8 [Phyllostomus discolor]|uniref:T-complex protein 1 subunit theta n=1 Tax=Phyllostomus discolor TaxID=89673 RepID=A0A834ASN3_9CHIR|nr:chaperonin containing TCP1 subunit 8 [Phyllostomus discolor]
MALHVPKAPGFAQMLKEGAKHFSGLEEAVYRNIQACKELAQTTRTAYGPNGMNKMVINHLEKLFVTNDAATILRELEVQHPAAKMIVMASHMQEQEVGDGTNFVLVFAGALLEAAEELLRVGLSVSEVIEGYEIACRKAHEILPSLVCCSAKNLRDVDEVASLLHTSVMSKQYGHEVFLAKLIAQACVSIFPDSGHFNVDNIRVCKILGSTDNLMDDVERAVDDGVNTFKVLTRDKRLVPGGGATEIELAKQITSYGETCPGLEQYAIKKFAEALEAIPRALAENSGVKANEVISKLYAVHQEGNKNVGLDIEAEVPAVKDMLEAGVLDTYLGKYWAIKLATNAAVTVLRVDQIIMAKPAGGPKPPSGKKDWDDDQND